MSERVLITGAGGFVGSALALGLSRLGFHPALADVAFDLEAERALASFERLGDARNLGADSRADYLIHCAALTADPADCGLGEAAHLAYNVSLGLAALELSERLRVRRTILISSAGVFSAHCSLPLDEEAQPDATSSYAAAKRMLELAGESLGSRGKLDVCSVRLGNLYGPREAARPSRPRSSLVARMALEARREGHIVVEAPTAERDWTLSEDLPGAFAALLRHPELPASVLHLASPETLSDERLARCVAKALEPEVGPVEVVLSDQVQLPARPPLTSRYAEALELPAWTSFADGLARTLEPSRAVSA